MRELSAKIAIDEKTFEPQLSLFLDGQATGVSMQVEAITDVRALHGPAAEQAVIDMTIETLNEHQKLTDEEKTYFEKNFKLLIAGTLSL